MPESNYLTTLASNTIYVGYSLQQSQCQIGRCIDTLNAQIGSAANPATLDQAYALTQKEYKNKTVVISFSAGVHGRVNQKYSWTPNVDFLGQGSSNTTILGHHSWINGNENDDNVLLLSLNTQITGLTFLGGNDPSFPTVYVQQGGRPEWIWQQNEVSVRSASGPLLDIRNHSDSILRCVQKNTDLTNTEPATDFLIRTKNLGNGRISYSAISSLRCFRTTKGMSAVQHFVSIGIIEIFIESCNTQNRGDGDLVTGYASGTGTLRQNYSKGTVISNDGSGIVHRSIITDSSVFNLSVNDLTSTSTVGKSVERVYQDNAVITEDIFKDRHLNTTVISQPLKSRLITGSASVTSTINNSSTTAHTSLGVPLIRNQILENGSFDINLGNCTLSNLGEGDGVLDQTKDDSVSNVLRFNYIATAPSGTVFQHKLEDNSNQDSLLQGGLLRGNVGYKLDNNGNSFTGNVSSTKMSSSKTSSTTSIEVIGSIGSGNNITVTGSQIANIITNETRPRSDTSRSRISNTSNIFVSGSSITSSSLTPAISSTGGNIKFAASSIINNGGGPAVFADRSTLSLSSSRVLHGDVVAAIAPLVQLRNAQCAIASSEISTPNRFIDADDNSVNTISSIISDNGGVIQSGGVIAYSGNASFINSNKINNAIVKNIENAFDPS